MKKNYNNDLPEGYTIIPYIKIMSKTKKWFLLNGFISLEEARKRGSELAKNFLEDIGTIFMKPTDYSYAIKISELVLPCLSETEQKNIVQMPIKTIISPYVPHLYRFLEKQYVDEFFETGKLKLTTFSDCAKHENKNKNDSEEGVATITTILGNGKRIEAKIGIGENAYMLCTTMQYNENLYKSLEYDACFSITDPMAFSNIIINKLQNVVSFVFGPCMYLSERELDNSRHVTIQDYEKIGFENNNNELDFQQMINFSTKGIEKDMMFLKKRDKYSNQNEYRLIWTLNSESSIKDGFIYIPEARQF